MNERIEFGDLILVRNRGWEIAVRDKGELVSIITPPSPTMDGSGVISYWAVKRADIEDHIRMAAVPGAIEALEMALLVLTSQYTTLEDHADAITLARNALRAVRGCGNQPRPFCKGEGIQSYDRDNDEGNGEKPAEA